ncbi:MAG: STAS-like domain-containing protein [Desulfobacula sp.]|nr:STAS-like domain-containing protein [Desulfobacula sp.]
MKELTININRDFSKYIGGREKRISQFSGEDFRERFLDNSFDKYDRIHIELDGVLGYPWDFLDEVFGVIAKRYGKEKFWEKIDLISAHNYVTDKITYIVNHSKKEG